MFLTLLKLLFNDCDYDFSAREELFYESRDNNDSEYIKDLIIEARNENLHDTLKLLFRLRKLGNRELFYDLFVELFNYDDEVRDALIYNIENVVKFGRWDDLIELYNRLYHDEEFCNSVLVLISEQLITDHDVINPSLVSKWIPSEGSKLDKPRHFYSHLSHFMGLKKGDLRKNYISPLRFRLNLIERNVCGGNFQNIDYMTLNEASLRKYEHIFLEKDRERFLEYKERVKTNLEDEIVNIYYKHFSNVKPTNIAFVLDLKMIPSVFKYAVAMLLNQSSFITFEPEPRIVYFAHPQNIRERIRLILTLLNSNEDEDGGVQLENVYSLIELRDDVEYVLILTNSMKYGYDLKQIDQGEPCGVPKCIYWNMKPNTPLHFFDYSNSQFETILMGFDLESLPYMFDSNITDLKQIMYKVLDSNTYKTITLRDQI